MIDLSKFVKVTVHKSKEKTMFKKIKEWFSGNGGLIHPMCADCNGMDCHKFPKCDHILLNKLEYDMYESEGDCN